jgi:hypothetical protein
MPLTSIAYILIIGYIVDDDDDDDDNNIIMVLIIRVAKIIILVIGIAIYYNSNTIKSTWLSCIENLLFYGIFHY